MGILIRESLFGRLINRFSRGKALPYPNGSGSLEKQPSTSEACTSSDLKEVIVVQFTGPDDPEAPRNWSIFTKSFATFGVMLLNFSFYAASAMYTPSIPWIKEEFGATDAEGTLGLSLFVIAYGIGPLVVSTNPS